MPDMPMVTKPSSEPAQIHESDEIGKHTASLAEVFGLDFMQRALWIGLIVGAVCGYLGVFVVLRRIIFVGMALAEFSSAGVAFSMLGNGIAPMLGSVIGMFAGVGLLSVQWGGRKVRPDAFVGIGYVVASALAILLIAKNPHGEGNLLNLLSGNIITVTPEDVLWTAIALATVFILHRVFARQVLFTAYDHDTAAVAGYNIRFWDTALYISIGIAIAFSIHAVGILVTFATLVIPATSALLLSRTMRSAFWIAGFLGALPIPLGLYLSYIWDLSPGATIVMLSFLFLALSGLISFLRRK